MNAETFKKTNFVQIAKFLSVFANSPIISIESEEYVSFYVLKDGLNRKEKKKGRNAILRKNIKYIAVNCIYTPKKQDTFYLIENCQNTGCLNYGNIF